MKKKLVIFLLAVVMVFGLVASASAGGGTQIAYVTLENMTYEVSDGAAWAGRELHRYEVEIADGDTIMDVTARAFDDNGIEGSGLDGGYINSVAGLSAGDGESSSGWMITLNDWFISRGANEFYPGDGDEIVWQFTLTRDDLGSTWENTGAYLDELKISRGTLSPSFASSTYDYVLTLPEGSDSVAITPAMVNKNFQSRIYLNAEVSGNAEDGYAIAGEADYEEMLSALEPWRSLPAGLDYYKRGQEITVADGDMITVAAALPGWHTMNNQGGGSSADSVPGVIYTIEVEIESEEPEPEPEPEKPLLSEVTINRISETKATVSFKTEIPCFYGYTVTAVGADEPQVDLTAPRPVGITEITIGNLADGTEKWLWLSAFNTSDGSIYGPVHYTIDAYEEEPEPATVTVQFAFFDPNAGTNGGFPVQWQEITVTEGTAASYGMPNAAEGHMVGGVDHSVPAGSVTVSDALFAMHELIYGDEFVYGSGGQLDMDSNSSLVRKMLGISSLHISFAVNDVLPIGDYTDGYAANECILQDGDNVLFYIYKDTYMHGDQLAYFDQSELTVQTGESFELNLSGHQAVYQMFWSHESQPTPAFNVLPMNDVNIVLINAETGLLLNETLAVTDSEGDFELSFDQPGTYIISAYGQIVDPHMFNMDADLIAPHAVITVEGEPVVDPDPDVYEVTVQVAPSKAAVAFYNNDGFDANDFDLLGSKIAASDLGVIGNYHTYSLSLPAGTYSYRGSDAAGESLGGMTFTIPSANADSEALTDTITLRQMDIYSTQKMNGAYLSAADLVCEINDANGKAVTIGQTYGTTYVKFPALVAVGSYDYTLTPQDTAIGNSFAVFTKTGHNVSAGTSILNAASTLPVYYIINAPAEASVEVWQQTKNYNQVAKEAVDTVTLPDGTVNHIYSGLSGSNIYRVSQDGKITQAGYINTSEAGPVISFGADEDPKTTAHTAAPAYYEASTLVNINHDQHLRLSVGEEFKVRGYRAAWQIVNDTVSNIMIEPDFNYQILSGSDVVSLVQDEAKSQWAMLTALKAGTAVIEVSYDAIEVHGGNYSGLYGATDPQRKAVFVVTVGAEPAADVIINVARDYKDPSMVWESEFDTYYFLGENAVAPVTVSVSGVSVQAWNPDYAVSRQSYTANGEGVYEITLYPGNNIVEVVKGDAVYYKVIRGAKVTPVLSQADPNKAGQAIAAGDTVTLHLDGLYMPMPKFSAIYNPGFGGSIKTNYNRPEGGVLQSSGHQYNFITAHLATFTIPEDASGEYVLSGGYISFSTFGDYLGEHYNITDAGRDSNLNAPSWSAQLCVLPDIVIDLGGDDEAEFTLNLSTTTPNVNVGDDVVVDIEVDSTKGFSVLQATLQYDKDLLQYVDTSLADAYSDGMLTAADRSAGVILGATFGEDVAAGQVIRVQFTAKAAGEINFDLADSQITYGDYFENVVAAEVGQLAEITAHSLSITFEGGHADLSGATTAYIRYNEAGLWADSSYSEAFVFPAATAHSGYFLSNPLKWTDGVNTYTNAELAAQKFTTSQTLTLVTEEIGVDAEIHFIAQETYIGAPSGYKVMLVHPAQHYTDYTYVFAGQQMYWSAAYCAHVNFADMDCEHLDGAYVYFVDADLTLEEAYELLTVAAKAELAIDYDGDVNDSGKIDLTDAGIVHGLAAGRTSFVNDANFMLSMLQRLEADINGDGVVDVQDVRIIQAIYLEQFI